MNGGSEPRERQYADFEIWVDPAPAPPYPVRVIHSPAGTATGEMILDVHDKEFRADLETVRKDYPNGELRQKFGQDLFRALFVDDVLARWHGSLGALKDVDGLRLRLRMDAPQLAALPWELLYDKDSGFLATAANQGVCRYLPIREPPPASKRHDRLRVLLLVESPESHGLKAIDPAEVKQLEEAIAALPNVEYKLVRNVADTDIQKELQDDYHVLHFLGHGREGALYLVAGDGKTGVPTYAPAFAQLFQGRYSLRLVVLNACGSSQEVEGGIFSGAGPALVKAGVPAVVAMQYGFVYSETAGLFSKGLYGALAKGYPVDVAVNEGRQIVAKKLPEDRDWSTPVLYLGAHSGRVLYLSGGDLVHEAARESALAAAALAELAQEFEEVAFRSSRLWEWLDFELRIQPLKSHIEKLYDKVQLATQAIAMPPEFYWIRVEAVRETWDDHCQEAISKFKSLGQRISYINKTLGNGDVPVDEWFSEVDSLGKELESLVSQALYATPDDKDQVRQVFLKLQSQCRGLGQSLRDQRALGQEYFRTEAEGLKERAAGLQFGLPK